MGEEKARAQKQKESEEVQMRDRLIELIKGSSEYICDSAALIERLADHLLENGVIVPKVNVGDKLYYISGVGKIVENEVWYVGAFAK